VGCGTGELSRAVVASASPAQVHGVDPSEGFVAYARARTPDSCASFKIGDAQELPYGDATFDAVVSGLVLNFVPGPGRAVAEMRRVSVNGGTVALYVWDYADRMQMMRYFWDAAVALDPDAAQLDEGRRFTICAPEALDRLLADAGFRDVAVQGIEVPTRFASFGDYWAPFTGGQGSAPGYVASLGDDRRLALRERLRETIPAAGDGSIHLVARAWAVRGTA
jgi:SAM-dependent methyltransferase